MNDANLSIDQKVTAYILSKLSHQDVIARSSSDEAISHSEIEIASSKTPRNDRCEQLRQKKIAVFGGGCFWCTEAVFEELRGVISVMPGYAGGATENPTYEQVSSGQTGHAEVIKIEYDPEQIGYQDLLTVFFATHNPTTMNQQGNDAGTQYRSIIFYTDDEQQAQAKEFIKKLNESTLDGKPIVTEIKSLDHFYDAENYHREYYRNNKLQPYCQIVINPKLKKLEENFANLLKSHRK